MTLDFLTVEDNFNIVAVSKLDLFIDRVVQLFEPIQKLLLPSHRFLDIKKLPDFLTKFRPNLIENFIVNIELCSGFVLVGFNIA